MKKNTAIRVLSPGLLTTVQDAGRRSFRSLGVPLGGAADQRSYVTANLLVGNNAGAAALEATLLGPALEFTAECAFAVTGADLGAQLNGAELPLYRCNLARRGDILAFAARRSGCRAYIAFAGGIDVPMVMGSRSTCLAAAFGGYNGRALAAGDRLQLAGAATLPGALLGRRAPENCFAGVATLRAIAGPQSDCFSAADYRSFFTTQYTLSASSDRMGCRLRGAALKPAGGGNIVSDAVCAGAVQVPGDGQPVLLLADCQTTGGYPKIACVVSVEIPRAAQCAPGDKVRFEQIEIGAAQALLSEQREKMQALANSFQ